jgi:aminoglycoside 6'-N-acetyltransferase I
VNATTLYETGANQINKKEEKYMEIVNLLEVDKNRIHQTAILLQESFESWPTYEMAINEVNDSLIEGKISRVLINSDGKLIGWIGGQSQYNGKVWEIHPLVVDKAFRGKGLGKLLVTDFERQVEEQGGITIILGSDDETNQTNVSNQDLYADIPGFIKNFQSDVHPVNFYIKLGFVIVGFIPDANGIGKPDIIMAKHIG